jgi:hypothetical protein
LKAVYTAGVVLPSPVAECRYWHRSLNPKKLVEIGFTRISERMNLARTIKLYKVDGVNGTCTREFPPLCRLSPLCSFSLFFTLFLFLSHFCFMIFTFLMVLSFSSCMILLH